MLAQHVEHGADVTVGCLEVPRAEASGFGVMHVDDARPHRRRSSRSRSDPPEMPGPARHGAGQHGHLRLPARVPDRPAAPRRRRSELDPRFRQGHHPLPGRARQGGRAPLRALLRALARRDARSTGATSARSTPTGRPTSTSPTSCPALDLYDRNWPIWTYAEITPPAKFVHDEDGRRGIGDLLARLRRLHRLRRLAAALAAVHRRARPLLRARRERRGAALRRHRPARAAHQRRRRPRRARSPTGSSSARIRSSTRSASAAPTTASA